MKNSPVRFERGFLLCTKKNFLVSLCMQDSHSLYRFVYGMVNVFFHAIASLFIVLFMYDALRIYSCLEILERIYKIKTHKKLRSHERKLIGYESSDYLPHLSAAIT